MATASLGDLVLATKAEAGHALSASQGLNALDTIKHIIKRTEYELWTAFTWPELIKRWDIQVVPGMTEYLYPAELQFDQIRQAFWAPRNAVTWSPVEYGIPEDGHLPYEVAPVTGAAVQFWETKAGNPPLIRVWPQPSRDGYFRIKGMTPLNTMCDDCDHCTLDPVAITLFAATELLQRAKSADAPSKEQKAQRHLTKLLGNKVSAKNKVSTFGAQRSTEFNSGFRPGQLYVPR